MNLENLTYIVTNILVPITVATLTYLLVDRLGEYKKRKNYCRLGIAIIDSLLEEVKTGINVMTSALAASEEPIIEYPPQGLFPNRTWSGLSTISDDVLLRILATSANRSFKSFHPSECRIHCKNYFGNICENYNRVLGLSTNIAAQGQDWRVLMRSFLTEDDGHYIDATKGVDQMLRDAKHLLVENTKRIFPK